MNLGSVRIDYLGNQKQFLPLLTEHMYQHWRSLLQAMGKSRDDFAQSMRDRCATDSLPLALVAFEGDQVLGTIALKPQDLARRPQLTPWLGGLFVLKKYRSQGIASLLITKILAEAERLRLPCLHLWTPASEDFYARRGWTLLERSPYHHCEISLMNRRLRNQAESPMKNLAVFMFALALAASGRHDKAAPTAIPALPIQAQPRLQSVKLWLGQEEILTELAATPDQVHTGMMFRTNLAENEGMLFDLGCAQRASFWMPNCPLPLSAAYINAQGVIREVHDLRPFDTNLVFSASEDIRFALETRQGWFKRHNIGSGTVIRTERGSLSETFSSLH